MRKAIPALMFLICVGGPLRAETGPEAAPESAASAEPAADHAPVQLGEGVVLPRAVFDEILAREDGLATIERMQERAEDSKRFQGVPHLVVIFASVLLFFAAAMFYYQRKHARMHRTIQLMVEKGVPLPAEILRAVEQFENGETSRPAGAGDKPQPPVWASNLLWGGLLWITIGITGVLYLWLRDSDAWPWGIAAMVYGLACVGTAVKQGAGRSPARP